MMKKVISLLLVFIMMFTLAACNKTEPDPTTPTDTEGYWYKNENIAINNFLSLKLDFYEINVSDADLQMYINYYILLPNAEYKEIKEGTLKMDDYLCVHVVTKDEAGNIIEKYTTGPDGYLLYIGLGDYLTGLDEALIGKNVGETVRFNSPITIDGKTINATVEATAAYLIEMIYPEPSDELAQKAGWQSMEAFKKEQREKLEVEYSKEAYNIFLKTAKEAIIAEVFNHPQDMVDSYVTKYRESLAFYSAMYGVSEDEYLKVYTQMSREDWEAQIQEQALKDVETELMLGAVLEALGLSLNDEAYKVYLERMAENAGYSSGAELEADMQEQNAMEDLKRELVMSYGYDMLLTYTNLRLIDWSTGTIIADFAE